MYVKQKSFEKMYKKVQNKRPIVKPNSGFLKQLLKFEIILAENNYDLSSIGGDTIEEIKEEVDEQIENEEKEDEQKIEHLEEKYSFDSVRPKPSSSYNLPKHFKLHRIEDI
mmetsp:Transcript_22193/g.24660  ORF Transcript_22193/g.24660 Transcript_22193/m.24660 type:complete len:111 (+) Transcript_22193:286-618(+)